jgi:hypothetical protein
LSLPLWLEQLRILARYHRNLQSRLRHLIAILLVQLVSPWIMQIIHCHFISILALR